MIPLLKRYPILFNPSSVIITLLLPTIILVTLPGVVIDSLILLSFISSILLLVIMLENDQPLRVTFLPTVVLLLTTFRLLLSIATTRNIIANEDVGHVIETVGEFVMGGNLISGLLIFVIITIVQFLVVTKGGERVAEVGARFSLDALPGRQMTIDGDLKSGLISGEQAQKLRADLSTENKLFGSLDGAMKFVKGDSIAGILISLVNLFGGIYVGINQFDLSLSESVSRFSVLTIGDGLVSQIPSLLLSLACGVYLTRIKGSEEESRPFIGQLMTQIRSFWKSLLIIGVVILLLGVFNLDLLHVCLPLALLCAILSFVLRGKHDAPAASITFDPKGSGVFESLKFVLRDSQSQMVIQRRLELIESSIWGQHVGIPAIIVDEAQQFDIEVFVSDIRMFGFTQSDADDLVEIMNDDVFVRNHDVLVNIAQIADYFLRKRLVEKYNLQYTSNIIADLSNESEVMKSEVDAAIGLNRVHDVLKEMIRAPEFYLDRISFFEALIYWSRMENEPKNWLTRIRSQAKYEITSRLLNKENQIHVALLEQPLTELIESFVMGEMEDVDRLLEVQQELRAEVLRLTTLNGNKPILVVNDNEITAVKAFFQQIVSTMPVCSHGDIADSACVASSEALQVAV
ncbi:FHIPEP family type III secretion protein [Vibrio anguillarum]|uniref:FHIPEP family type III secretion protein n=1 Tax=Vibrio anguillarum TaxID=55601 RepID=UPI00097E233D|nr:FHIPEP family type III secretion protein [Vibrio anguillarum]AQM21000.1 type III secretion protein [Vibrio anguillarum]AUB86016.1 type III secretion protein [Vibrio anguillarum]AUB89453.1 type III secretion protein [Vibrio anguillarum]AUB92894.1 type III secretion protein [Vibrio anguillarum]AUB96327.1 type III secretion protein [Vibrio anguillarum]